MQLKNLLSSNKTIKAEYPELDGFTVELCYISRETTIKLRKACTTQQFDKKTRQVTDTLDEKLFLDLYIKEVIKGWTGLKLSYLAELILVDLDNVANLEDELEYTHENAVDLMKNSTYFDSWVSSIMDDVANFNKSA